MKWFYDKYSGFGICLETKKLIYSKKTKYQTVKVFDTKKFGKMMALDTAIQFTERDEFIYHEIIAHVPLFSSPNPKRVLIIGGGDGGILREVLKHPIKEVFLVEIDKEVIEVSKKYFPEIAGESFRDKRVKIIIGDGADFIKNIKNFFDIIIIDSLDPIGPAKTIFSAKFYNNIRESLNKNGLVVCQSGPIMFWEEAGYGDNYRNFKKIFSKTDIFLSPIATYPGAIWSFIIGFIKITPKTASLDIIKKRYKELKIKTKYYNPEIHFSSFVLPNFIKDYIKEK